MPGHEQYVGRLVIPYLTRAGVVTMKFRSMDSTEPKYLCLPASKPRLYNVEALFADSPVIAICEGELDAAILHYQCEVPAVGCPGVSTWQEHFPRLFAGYDAVYVFADGDRPGADFAKRLQSELDNAITIQTPEGSDVNDVYLLEGADGLRKRAGLE